MKKRLHSVSFLATLAVILGIVSWGGLLQAQQTSPDAQQPSSQTQQPPDTQAPPAQQSPDTQAAPSQTPDTQTPSRQSPDQPGQTPSQSAPSQSGQRGSQAQTSDQGGAQTFTGTVVKQGDKYVLQDAATGTTYDIDHQDEVKKFEGKKVRVHGTLDASGKMIHVQ